MKENVKAKMDETHVKAEELCWEMVGGNTEMYIKREPGSKHYSVSWDLSISF